SLLGLAALGFLTRPATAVLLGLLALLGGSEFPTLVAAVKEGLSFLKGRPLGAFAVIGPAILAAAFAFAPPHQYDSLVYHLVLPEIYVKAGGLAKADWL